MEKGEKAWHLDGRGDGRESGETEGALLLSSVTPGKAAGKGSAFGLLGEKRLKRRIRVLRLVIRWTRLLSHLGGGDEAFLALAPFFKRHFSVDGFALWVREPGRFKLALAWPPVLEEAAPLQLSWRNGHILTPREAFALPAAYASRLDLLIARPGDAPLGWLILLRRKETAFTVRERNLLRKLMELFAMHLSAQVRVRDAEAQAMTDVLTAIWNRRYFADRYPAELQRARRYHRSLAVLMIDLDTFKAYNDTYGHLAGDQALRVVAQVLKNNLRASDILCRYGGEEFVVLLPESDLDHALLAAEKLRRAVAAEPLPIGHGMSCGHATISIGVAACPENGEGETELLHQADRALYQAKQAGRDRVLGARETLPSTALTAGMQQRDCPAFVK
ncbi:MAG TPA: GGDEF domain-containing protein [bacterium]|nr:GGDEF domain-containing protein [bacterium]HQG45154.1 GGDEF domain-containing protein [bacterium]HQI47853.1 GGDEF domain-containing protein [bacterium]HQJ64313.1 GGDEF domain-containing protein [bacterium]